MLIVYEGSRWTMLKHLLCMGLKWGGSDRLSGRSRIGTSDIKPSIIQVSCSDRLSGRSRIGTIEQISTLILTWVAIGFRVDRGLELEEAQFITPNIGVAIGFRVDRGLELCLFYTPKHLKK